MQTTKHLTHFMALTCASSLPTTSIIIIIIIIIPYFTALFLRTARVSLTKQFLLTAVPNTD